MSDPQYEAKRRWREENREKQREQTKWAKLRSKYGLHQHQYEALLEKQNHRCAICKTDEPGGRGTWHVDHCHDSNVVRGLLCSNCNRAIGLFKDDIDRLDAAIDYLSTAR